METASSCRSSLTTAVPPLELMGRDGDYHCRVMINQERIRSSCVEVWKNEETRIKGILEIAFPVLSKKRFFQVIEHHPHSLCFKIIKQASDSGDQYSVKIESTEFQERALVYEEGLSNERFSLVDPVIIRSQAEDCWKEENGEEKRSFLLSIVQKSAADDVDQKTITAAINAIEILVRARFPFSGKNLEKVRIPGAILDEGMFHGTILREADLASVSFKRAFLAQADLRAAKLKGIEASIRKPLEVKGLRDLSYAQEGGVLAVKDKEGIAIYDFRNKSAHLSWRLSEEEAGGYVSSVAISEDGEYLALSISKKNITIWNIPLRKKMYDFPFDGYAKKMAFSSRNNWFSAVRDRYLDQQEKIFVWNLSKGSDGAGLVQEFLLHKEGDEFEFLRFSSSNESHLFFSICGKLNSRGLTPLADVRFYIRNVLDGSVVKEIVVNRKSPVSNATLCGSEIFVADLLLFSKINIEDLSCLQLLDLSEKREIAIGVYFHPEKSQITYLSITSNFQEVFIVRYDLVSRSQVMHVALKNFFRCLPLELEHQWVKDHDLLLVGNRDENKVVVIDLNQIGELNTRSLYFYGASISQDNRYLGVFSYDYLNIFSLQNGGLLRSIGLPFSMEDLIQMSAIGLTPPADPGIDERRDNAAEFLTAHLKDPSLNRLTEEDLDRMSSSSEDIFQYYENKQKSNLLAESFRKPDEKLVDFSLNKQRSFLITLSEYKNPVPAGDDKRIVRIWEVDSRKEVIHEQVSIKSDCVGISEDGSYFFIIEEEASIAVWKKEETGGEVMLKLQWRYPYQFSSQDALISDAGDVEENEVLDVFEGYGAKRM